MKPVAGNRFLPQDSLDEIGRTIARWLRGRS
jgi:hypothetical protein